MPIIHAVPALQPLVPSPGCTMNEAGCVCFLRLKIMQKITKKPATDRNNVACVILGTHLGHRNSGQAIYIISYGILLWIGVLEEEEAFTRQDNSCEVHEI